MVWDGSLLKPTIGMFLFEMPRSRRLEYLSRRVPSYTRAVEIYVHHAHRSNTRGTWKNEGEAPENQNELGRKFGWKNLMLDFDAFFDTSESSEGSISYYGIRVNQITQVNCSLLLSKNTCSMAQHPTSKFLSRFFYRPWSTQQIHESCEQAVPSTLDFGFNPKPETSQPFFVWIFFGPWMSRCVSCWTFADV